MRLMNDMAPKGLGGGLTNYGDPAFASYLRRSFARSMGYSRELLAKPVVGITWTASGFNNCHRGVPELIEAVKRGVLAAGGGAPRLPGGLPRGGFPPPPPPRCPH